MVTIEDKIQYLDDLLDTNDNVIGEIYMIINLINTKIYIGQVVSHRKNRGKYRPFGFRGRLKDHISEAVCQTKVKQSTYLNNAIRKNGVDNFSVELIRRCERSEMDFYEQYYIDYYQTMFPNGYNLTIGGAGQFYVASVSNNNIVPEKIKYVHSEETKQKISIRLKQSTNTLEFQQMRSKSAQKQHDDKKLPRFINCTIDHNNLEKYIHSIHSAGQFSHYKICINGKRIAFRGKFQTPNEMKERALIFLRQIPSFSAK